MPPLMTATSAWAGRSQSRSRKHWRYRASTTIASALRSSLPLLSLWGLLGSPAGDAPLRSVGCQQRSRKIAASVHILQCVLRPRGGLRDAHISAGRPRLKRAAASAVHPAQPAAQHPAVDVARNACRDTAAYALHGVTARAGMPGDRARKEEPSTNAASVNAEPEVLAKGFRVPSSSAGPDTAPHNPRWSGSSPVSMPSSAILRSVAPRQSGTPSHIKLAQTPALESQRGARERSHNTSGFIDGFAISVAAGLLPATARTGTCSYPAATGWAAASRRPRPRLGARRQAPFHRPPTRRCTMTCGHRCRHQRLAAAHYRAAHPAARILLLDNHDEFGGHARRNEFMVDGRCSSATAGQAMPVTRAFLSRGARQCLRILA